MRIIHLETSISHYYFSFVNNHFFFGLCKPSCFIPRFGNLLVPVVVDFDAYCSSRISKLTLISSGFKPFFLFCAGSILDSEDFRGSCSLSSGVKLSESVWRKNENVVQCFNNCYSVDVLLFNTL